MRHPPSPLLLSARKRRPRRNPPRGMQLGSPTPGEQRAEAEMQQQQSQVAEEKCALLAPDPSKQDEEALGENAHDEAQRDGDGQESAR